MEYKAVSKTLEFKTRCRLDFYNVTKEVEEFVQGSGIKTGTITLQTPHTTCGLWVNEDEQNLIGPEKTLGRIPDLQRSLDRLAGPDEEYGHNDIRTAKNPNGKRYTHLCPLGADGESVECVDGYSHAQNMAIHSYLTLIIEGGKVFWASGRRYSSSNSTTTDLANY